MKDEKYRTKQTTTKSMFSFTFFSMEKQILLENSVWETLVYTISGLQDI